MVSHEPNVTADDAIRMAAGQVWVFSATDVQIISRESGFARIGAFLSSRFHNIYSIDGFHTPGHPRRCGRTEYDTIEASAQQWSGIR
ncbi:g5369 [Coccomyxa elongata]